MDEFNIADYTAQLERTVEMVRDDNELLEEQLEIATKALTGEHEGCTKLAVVYCPKCGRFPGKEVLAKIAKLQDDNFK